MTRRAIFTIITLMAVALVGLIGFQLYWINNAILLSQERFEKDVHESLRNVSERLERNELLFVASNSFISESPMKNGVWIASEETDEIVDVHVDSNFSKYSRTIKFKSNQNKIHETRVYSNIVIDSLHNGETFSFIIGDNDSVFLDLEKVANKSARINVIVKELLEFEKSIENRVHPSVIDSLLFEEFNNKGIHIQYEFGVFDSKKNRFVLAKFENEDDLKNSSLKATLFPNDLLNNTNYLTVNFPQQDEYLLKKVWATLASSLLLIGIIIFSFVYAIRIILRQKKLSEIKNDFINNMTHEFKTPIATVSLACEALHEEAIAGNPETYYRYLKVIREETRRLENQVEKVLSAAQLDKDDFRINPKTVDLRSTIEEVVNSFQFRIDELSGKIDFDIDTELHDIWADETLVKNVLSNLLDNAIKYSTSLPQIAIRLFYSKDFVCVSIRDSGLGIKKENQRNIFDKFYRVSTGNVHNTKGFGLGLSYVKSIMDQHKGEVKVVSEPGKGSMFTLSFPANQLK